MSYLREAFYNALDTAEVKEREEWHVCLMEENQYYGGPEEGGWWGTDHNLIAYRTYPTEELANEAAEKIKKFAQECSEDARRAHNQQCANELDWLEARGLPADWLPEPDGYTTYKVIISNEIPQPVYGPRHYE